MQESATRSLLILLTVALVCSVLVSVATVLLRPIQAQNELIERYRNIAGLSGLLDEERTPDDQAVLEAVESLDVRVVNLDTGRFVDVPVETVDARAAAARPDQSVALSAEADHARLGRRAIFEVVYLVWSEGELARLIVPIHGQGMWSTLYGFLALESDLNTIAAVTFYEQNETAGLGDQIENPEWLAHWRGRRLFNQSGNFQFRVAQGVVDDDAPLAVYQVDGLSGATVTANAVTALLRFWFGPDGYGRLLTELQQNPAVRPRQTAREL